MFFFIFHAPESLKESETRPLPATYLEDLLPSYLPLRALIEEEGQAIAFV